ncbi:MAG: hypothetical protein Q8922_07025 [Bacteroidota bacterium]|nr:hypothetical protein [Bacteroidota bacterium]MDP4234023.1 hypothetical protein [Bacteroidota bacterium]MDP4242889.1 hypothetical protein [Bacteroidota bacterium]MDP4287672.1 hypothetical protein [Bacteroidota bacterium]
MIIQSLIVWGLVAVAAWHIGKHVYGMVRGVIDAKGGCATGCGNCGYAPKEDIRVNLPIGIDLPSQ